MFKFLKERLKGAIEKFSKKVEEAPPSNNSEKLQDIRQETRDIEIVHETNFLNKKDSVDEISKTTVKDDSIGTNSNVIIEEVIDEQHESTEKNNQTLDSEKPKKKLIESLKEKLTTKVISSSQFDEIFWDLELSLMENNVAIEVVEKLKNDLKKDITQRPIRRNKIREEIINSLKQSILGLFDVAHIDLVTNIKSKPEKPFVIVFFGINGSGKTTTISKISYLLKNQGLSSVLVAADTFRAAAIQQLEEHAHKLNVRIIKHNYGSDPAAVCFDGINYAKAHNIDAVLIDTAGRLHSNKNLLDEMKKIARVSKPDLKIFVGESITGNDVIEQARSFNDLIGLDAIILTKSDIDEKGGTLISISYVVKKPILYLGTGQSYQSLELFSKELIMSRIGL